MSAIKKRKNYNNLKLVCAVLLIASFIILILRWIDSHRVKFAHYDAFGIDLPTAYHMHGIDVSRYQKEIGWKEVKHMNVQGITMSFVFIKATEGYNLTDKYFKYNWKTAKKEQMTRGAYHFFNPSQKPTEQALYFISKVKLLPGDLPPVLDAEQAGTLTVDSFRTNIKTWLTIVTTYYKVKPVIYTNADFYRKYMGSDFDDYPLWVAHYYERVRPRVDRNWTFWQHNDRGNISGINAKVDFNVFNGDSTDFQQLLIR